MIDVAGDMRSSARRSAMADVRGCPLPSFEQEAHVANAVAKITDEYVACAIAWSQRFVLEYGSLLEEMQTHIAGEPEPDNAAIVRARVRLEWWKRVAELGKYECGLYDSVGTRDRLRMYLRGEFYDEVDACLMLFGRADAGLVEMEKSA